MILGDRLQILRINLVYSWLFLLMVTARVISSGDLYCCLLQTVFVLFMVFWFRMVHVFQRSNLSLRVLLSSVISQMFIMKLIASSPTCKVEVRGSKPASFQTFLLECTGCQLSRKNVMILLCCTHRSRKIAWGMPLVELAIHASAPRSRQAALKKVSIQNFMGQCDVNNWSHSDVWDLSKIVGANQTA